MWILQRFRFAFSLPLEFCQLQDTQLLYCTCTAEKKKARTLVFPHMTSLNKICLDGQQWYELLLQWCAWTIHKQSTAFLNNSTDVVSMGTQTFNGHLRCTLIKMQCCPRLLCCQQTKLANNSLYCLCQRHNIGKRIPLQSKQYCMVKHCFWSVPEWEGKHDSLRLSN